MTAFHFFYTQNLLLNFKLLQNFGNFFEDLLISLLKLLKITMLKFNKDKLLFNEYSR